MSFIKPTPAAKLFFSSLVVSTGGLGCWQTQRYNEKVSLIESRKMVMKEGLGVKDYVFSDGATSMASNENISVRYNIKGKFLYDKTVYVNKNEERSDKYYRCLVAPLLAALLASLLIYSFKVLLSFL